MEAERVFCAHKLCKPLASSFCDLLGGRVQCGQYDSFLTLVLSGNSWNSGVFSFLVQATLPTSPGRSQKGMAGRVQESAQGQENLC